MTAKLEGYSLCVYWGDRNEAPELCASRARRCLAELAALDSSFARWHRQGSTLEDALQSEIKISEATLGQLFADGVNRKDVPPRRVIQNLGFRVALWNGQVDSQASISMNCGCYAANAGLVNSCV